MRWVARSWKVGLLEFRHKFWSIVTRWMIHVHSKSQLWHPTMKIHVCLFQIRAKEFEDITDRICGLLTEYWEQSASRAVINMVIIVLSAPMTCRVLKMMSAGDHANLLEHW
jgi:hypothetical protein